MLDQMDRAVVIPNKLQLNDDCSHIIAPGKSSRKRRKHDNPTVSSSELKAAKSTGHNQRLRQNKQQQQNPDNEELPLPKSISESEFTLTPLRQYEYLLIQGNGLSPCSPHHSAFVLQDFDQTSNKLKDAYHIVRRRHIKCCDGAAWVYACECTRGREALVLAIEEKYKGSVQEIKDLDQHCKHQECLHIQACRELLKSTLSVDEYNDTHSFNDESDHQYGKSQDIVEFYPILSTEHAVCVHISNSAMESYAIVKVNFQGGHTLACSVCKKAPCKHTNAIRCSGHSSAEVLKGLLAAKPSLRARYVPHPVSKSQIDFSMSSFEPRSKNSFIPDTSGICVCGCPWGDLTDGQESMLFTTTTSSRVRVFDRQCSKCEKTKEFDGGEEHLLNMGTYMVSHQVFRQYSKQFLTDGTTLSSFYKTLVWQHAEKGDCEFSNQLSYYRFRYAWYAYLDLLEIKYEEGFHCPCCGESPEVVIMDGVTLGIKKTHMNWKMPQEETQNLDGSSRVLVKNQRCRKLLRQFSIRSLNHQEMAELQSLLTTYAPFLEPLFSEIDSNLHYGKCPQIFSSLIHTISSDYPLLALIHIEEENVVNILMDESKGANFRHNISHMAILEDKVPTLFSLLSNFSETPAYVRPVLLAFVENTSPADAQPGLMTEYFPSLGICNSRGTYVLDNRTSRGPCRKSPGSHPSLTPGLFTLSCEHGVCYGFSMMEDSESPNVPFSLLRTRFKKAPKMVIYDNACNLHAYCMNRDPGFFKNTWFVVDRFHWPNHKGCHDGYNLSTYRKYKNINTQVAEQRNATLNKLRSMVSYMDVENFMSHCRFFVWFRSMVSMAAKHQDKPNQYTALFQILSKVYSTL